eukprot:7187424-Prymnesium_polylepis.2
MGSGQSVRKIRDGDVPLTPNEKLQGGSSLKAAVPKDEDLLQYPSREALLKATHIMTSVMPACPSSQKKLLTRVQDLLLELHAESERNKASRRMSTRDEKEARTSRISHIKSETKHDEEMQSYLMKNFDDIKEENDNGPKMMDSKKMSMVIKGNVQAADLLKRVAEVIDVVFIPTGLSDAALTTALDIAIAIDRSDW